MGILAWVLALLGAFSLIASLVAALGYCAFISGIFTPMYWLVLSGVLFLTCIAAGIASHRREPD